MTLQYKKFDFCTKNELLVIYKQVFFCYEKNDSRRLDNKVMFGVKTSEGMCKALLIFIVSGI